MSELVRCPACRSVAPVTVVWAIGDACPRCSVLLRRQDRHAVRRRGGTDGSVLRTVVGSGRAASAVVPPGGA